MPDPVAGVCRTYRAQRVMGGRCEEHELFTLVCAPDRPDVWDANFACDVRATTPEEIGAVVDALEARVPDAVRVRRFFCDPLTPQPFAAALCVRGFERESTVQLVLEDELRPRPGTRSPAVEVRRVESDADWAAVAELTALDMTESLAKKGHGPPEASFLRQFVGMRRAMSDAMHMWLAHHDGQDCGFVASWSGVDGLGMVEWLFCHPAQRRRGIASALLAHGVADARRRGAGSVLIGASAGSDAVPRRLYASLGFRPVCLTDEYTRFV
jgi:GNAT superfamily N-acetyltransferase